jgi:hypothetical protein
MKIPNTASKIFALCLLGLFVQYCNYFQFWLVGTICLTYSILVTTAVVATVPYHMFVALPALCFLLELIHWHY